MKIISKSVTAAKGKRKKLKREEVVESVAQLQLDELLSLISSITIMAHFSLGNVMTEDQKKDLIPIVENTIPILIKIGLPDDMYISVFNEILSESSVEQSQRDLTSFLKSVATYQKQLASNSNMSQVMLTLLNNARLMAAGSESAKKNIEMNVGILQNKLVSSLFAEDKNVSQIPFFDRVEQLVKLLGGEGKEGQYRLTVGEQKEAAAKGKKDPQFEELRQELLTLRREAWDAAKKWLRSYIRSNSDDRGLTDYRKLRKQMKKKKLYIHNFAEGFNGFIDDKLALYTTEGLKINGSPNGGVIRMNPQYDPKKDNAYVFMSDQQGAITTSRYYTESYKAKATKSKFETVDKLGDSVKNLRKKWRSRIKTKKIKHKDFYPACILEIIYQCQARIGSSSGNSEVDGSRIKTFGMSSIQCKHLRIVGKGVNISYPGKKGMKQIHKLENDMGKAMRIVIKFLEKRKKEGKPGESVFPGTRGIGPLPTSRVNDYLKRCGADASITVHKLRHLKGTQMMEKILEKHPWKKDSKNASSSGVVTKWLKVKALAIGKVLGHYSNGKVTPTTAIANYCKPAAMIELYQAASVPLPTAILKIAGIDAITLKQMGVEVE